MNILHRHEQLACRQVSGKRVRNPERGRPQARTCPRVSRQHYISETRNLQSTRTSYKLSMTALHLNQTYLSYTLTKWTPNNPSHRLPPAPPRHPSPWPLPRPADQQARRTNPPKPPSDDPTFRQRSRRLSRSAWRRRSGSRLSRGWRRI